MQECNALVTSIQRSQVSQLYARMVELRKSFNFKVTTKRFGLFLWKPLKRYLSNCSIHGVRYLVEDGRHWTERLFWLICCGISWWGCILMVLGVFSDFSNRQVATTVETNYLHWRAELPSIHVCYVHTPEADALIKQTWKNKFTAKKLTASLTFGYVANMAFDVEALKKVADAIKLPCDAVFESCEWNDEKVDCCKIFHYLWTPGGRCLSVNSIYTKDSALVDDSFFLRDPAKSGVFTIVFRHRKDPMVPVIYIMNKHGMPTITTGAEKKLSNTWKTSNVKLDITQQPTYNEVAVSKIPIEMRNCRFSDEHENFMYFNVYGYDACLVEGILRAMMKFCGCISHLYPHGDETKVCDDKGLACLTAEKMSIISTTNLSCIADCEETTYDMHLTYEGARTPGNIYINLLPGPTMRYRRYVVHSKLDLVVAVGSAVGLFVGASILSIVEIPYWLIIRSLNDDNDDDNDQNEEAERARRQND